MRLGLFFLFMCALHFDILDIKIFMYVGRKKHNECLHTYFTLQKKGLLNDAVTAIIKAET